MTSKFNIADFNIGPEGWDSYSIGEKLDLDNDGENELIICGTGIYLDVMIIRCMFWLWEMVM